MGTKIRAMLCGTLLFFGCLLIHTQAEPLHLNVEVTAAKENERMAPQSGTLEKGSCSGARLCSPIGWPCGGWPIPIPCCAGSMCMADLQACMSNSTKGNRKKPAKNVAWID